MKHIKPSSAGVSLVVILPLFWISVTCQGTHVCGYTITVASNVSVQEGLCVSIPCTFTARGVSTFTNSTGYWYQYNGNNIVASNNKSSPGLKNNFRLTGNPDTGDCTLTISDARRGDNGEYYFRYEDRKDPTKSYNYINSGETTPHITVTDLTEEPVISDLGSVRAGINKTVTCSPPGNCPATSLTFQWRKSNVPGIWRKNSSTITFTPSLDDDNTTITCEMSHSRGNTTQRTLPLYLCYTSPPSTPPTDTLSYQDLALGFSSGLIFASLIILLYKLVPRTKVTKRKTHSKETKASADTDPPTDEIYMNVTEPEEATDNINDEVSMDEKDVKYSAIIKHSNVSSDNPVEVYAQIHKKGISV
ncbi:myeloid cell surface antigen CD33-like [Engystomops pustulosus]|uniref:myeloid cell surface antigen CD33-like n=1 Tax=Engystomops pustulosus TaxID=76066 RepID=UPI003AFA26EE